MARQQRFDWLNASQRRPRKSTASRRRQTRGRRPLFEALESRAMLSATPFSVAPDYGAPLPGEAPGEHQHEDVYTAEDWLGEFYEPIAAATAADHADALTIILDFIEPTQENGRDGIGNQVTTFDVGAYGFAPEDYELVTEAVLEEVRSHYYDIATDDVFPQSAIPAGMELHVEFEIGDQGTPPINGSTDYYYVQIGTYVSGSCGGALGCASLSSIRDQFGAPGAAVGSVVGSIFSDAIQGLFGLTPSNALSSGDVDFTAKALGGTTSHEIGHAVSLNHLAKAGSVTPNDLPPIMGTGAIDLPNQDRIEPREFAYSGRNPQQGNQEQFHITQLVGALGLTEAGSGPRGGTIVVDTIEDESDGNFDEGDLSLREAIEMVAASGRRQEIKFAEALSGETIALKSELGSLLVTSPVVITGLGADELTIQAPTPDAGLAAGGDGQIFVIAYEGEDPLPTRSVSIEGVTLLGANAVSDGGAIYSVQDLELNSVAIRDNTTTGRGGAVYASASLAIEFSDLLNNHADSEGGALYVMNGVTADSTTLANNSSGDVGGAIAAVGDLTRVVLTSSTISGNTATGNGGGIHIADENPVKFQVLNSTVYNNTTDGSGGGIYQLDGVLALEHSILAGNTANGTAPNTAQDLDNVNVFATPVALARYSLIQSPNGSSIVDQGPNLYNIDPMLNPLADNGGPTLTHIPMLGSPIINGGNPDIPFPPEFDQRGLGFKRIREGVIDIGAVESTGFGIGSPIFVDTLQDVVNPNDGLMSLREAIVRANAELGPNLIEFDPLLNGGTIDLASELLISDSTVVDASFLSLGITVNATTSGARVLRIDDGGADTFIDVELIGMALSGGDVTGNGGAIHSVENLKLDRVSVLDSHATGDGGGVYHLGGATGGTLRIENSTLANNQADGNGGGLWSNTNLPDPELDPDPNAVVGTMINSTVSGNTAGDQGGGIMNFDGQLELRHVTVTDNFAQRGGGVVSFGDALTKTLVYSTIISGNDSADPLNNGDVQRSFNVSFNSFESLGYNFIGDGDAVLNFTASGDRVNMLDPMLGPLADNGGPTLTHLPLDGSPVIDTGDPEAIMMGEMETETTVLLPEFDQRGDGFPRKADGDRDGTALVDIGAVEVPAPEPSGDFDEDGDTDGADFLAWQRGFGLTNATRGQGDANSDGNVNGDDLQIWTEQFGITIVTDGLVSSHTVSLAPAPAAAADVSHASLVVNRSNLTGLQEFFSRDLGDSTDPLVQRETNEFASFAASTAAATILPSAPLAFPRNPSRDAVAGEEGEAEEEAIEVLDAVFESLGLERAGIA